MKVLHLPDSFLPSRTGGKEVFVYNLAMELKAKGVDNLIAIHANESIGLIEGYYEYNGLAVKVLPQTKNKYINVWDRLVDEAIGFEELLIQEKPDVIHFHDQNNGASLSHLRIAKRLGIKTVLSYHSPGQSCPQRGLLYKGKYACNGQIKLYKCTRCLLSCKGLPEPMPLLMAFTNLKLASFESNKLNRVLAIKSLISIFKNTFNEIYSLHNKIQVHADWCKALLILNGVPENKIFITKQGIPSKSQEPEIDRKEGTSKLKLLFIGRCENIKGVHILIDAVKQMPKNFPIEVHILGPYWNTTEYGRIQLRKIENDIRFLQPQLLSPSEVGKYMQTMDACVIPSLWPETGPLVMLEALQAGLPVIGSNFAGIAETIKHNENGLLFERGNAKMLSNTIQRLSKNKIEQLKTNIKPVRNISSMAEDIIRLYQDVMSS